MTEQHPTLLPVFASLAPSCKTLVDFLTYLLTV